MELPKTSFKEDRPRHSQVYKIIQPRPRQDAEYSNPSSINYEARQHHPYEYYGITPTVRHSEHKNYPHAIHDHHNHIHHSYHHHRETYDPRWWYMPRNSVHGPKSYQQTGSHRAPTKWYEFSSRK